MKFTRQEIESVNIEIHDKRTGWAIFTGCNGEDPDFHAYFPIRKNAEDYIRICNASEDENDHLCDPDIAPALLREDGIVCANNFDNQLGVEALIDLDALRFKGVEPFGSEEWRQEAAATMNKPR